MRIATGQSGVGAAKSSVHQMTKRCTFSQGDPLSIVHGVSMTEWQRTFGIVLRIVRLTSFVPGLAYTLYGVLGLVYCCSSRSYFALRYVCPGHFTCSMHSPPFCRASLHFQSCHAPHHAKCRFQEHGTLCRTVPQRYAVPRTIYKSSSHLSSFSILHLTTTIDCINVGVFIAAPAGRNHFRQS
jgi:hypothetical protein